MAKSLPNIWMNLTSGGTRSMGAVSNSRNWRPVEAMSDRFPAGLRVLVVDFDPTCLAILEQMLKGFHCEVTKCNRAAMALSLLREKKNGYDIVISEVHMPDMDGFKLLEHVGLEMDLPVIMMSADDTKALVMKAVTHGACDYLIKPVRMDALKNIWQHVVGKKKDECKELEQTRSGEEVEKHTEDADYLSWANEGSLRNSKKCKEDDDDLDDREDSSNLKKPRVVWSLELHRQFITAVNQLGIDNAVPEKILELMNVQGLTMENVAGHLQKYRFYLRRISGDLDDREESSNLKNPRVVWPVELYQRFLAAVNQFGIDNADPEKILELMNVQGLTRENVADHLQKYRLYIRRIIGDMTQHPGVLNNGYMGLQDGPFGGMSSLTGLGLGLPATAASRHLPAQSLASLNSAQSLTLSNMAMFQRSMAMLQRMNNGRQINSLHGIPTNMESKQLTSLNSGSTIGSVNMHPSPYGNRTSFGIIQAAQPQASSHLSKIPPSMGFTGAPNGAGIFQMRNSNLLPNNHSTVFPLCNSKLPGDSFPFANAPVSANGMVHNSINSRMKDTSSIADTLSNYNMFNNMHQLKPQAWESQGVGGLQFDNSCQTNVPQGGNFDVSPSVKFQQLNVPTGSVLNVGNAPPGYYTTLNTNCQIAGQSSVKIKGEMNRDLDCPNNSLPQHYGKEDLKTALLKQHPGAIEAAAGDEFNFDGDTPISCWKYVYTWAKNMLK